MHLFNYIITKRQNIKKDPAPLVTMVISFVFWYDFCQSGVIHEFVEKTSWREIIYQGHTVLTAISQSNGNSQNLTTHRIQTP